MKDPKGETVFSIEAWDKLFEASLRLKGRLDFSSIDSHFSESKYVLGWNSSFT